MMGTKETEENAVLKGYNMLLYFTGSMIMYEPVEECVVDFWSKGILKSLPVKSGNPRFMIAASQLRESCRDTGTCQMKLKKDYLALFADPALPLAPPNKSYYLDMISESCAKESVTDFYNAYGWKKRTRYNIPDDNLGIELLFLTLLIEKYIAFDDDACRNEMKNEIRRFLHLHVLSWLPEWNSRMQEYAETLCYKGISTLIYACCEDINDLLGDQPAKISDIAQFKN
ncbi:MAG: molecular chaperone TorD family protein [Bacteroidales bacterium]|jgi:TorA maturation chaperone TorD|nr:molecular chaperone TorD family protein [Bacteroidales bacterium]